ncbi:hypothetical protein LguiB_006833 [Lonicera macranthoides]
MAPSKLRKAIGAVKDQTSISLAKVGGSTSLADLDVAIVKATRHEEYPAEERHIREILSLTVYSRAYVGACVSTISRRLNKTKNWVVALKAVMLIHRLLNDGDPAYEQEIFFATRRGTRLLNLSDFRDTSQNNSWDYSAFVRTYALYLDEQLEFRMQGRRGKRSAFAYEEEEEEVGPGAIAVRTTPLHELKNEQLFSRLQHMLLLLERFLACRPTGEAKSNRVVVMALYTIVKESFQLYYDITEIMGILLDRFMELDIPDSVKVHEIFCRVAKQYDELDTFYSWCKCAGIARSSEYPEVDKISNKKLDVMDEFIREKSLMGHNIDMEPEDEPMVEPQQLEPEPEPEEDMNATKALPPPEGFVEETEKEEKKEEVEIKKKQEVGDLLNLGEKNTTTEQYGDKLALALFDSGCEAKTAPSNGTLPWEAFKDTGDWETALVQSASHLSNQKATLPGGFDTLMLDGMYQQRAMTEAAASSSYIATGSASSVALGSTGRPAMLALPAPKTAQNAEATSSGGDPFAASLAVPPPSYVQMSEMEKKQRLLVEEQVMWQQYTSNGMQGHAGLAKVQHPNAPPYNMGGGYTQSY